MVLYGEEQVCMDHLRDAIRLSGFVVINPESCMRFFCAVSACVLFLVFLRSPCRRGGLYVRCFGEGYDLRTHTNRVDVGGPIMEVNNLSVVIILNLSEGKWVRF